MTQYNYNPDLPDEDEWAHNSCHDCSARPGQMHILGCDVERCPDCGHQMISCGCDYERPEWRDDSNGPLSHGGKYPRIVWTGEWPGYAECQEWNWYAKRNPDGAGYIPCSQDDPGARLDLNRLYSDPKCRWNPEKGRYTLDG